MAAPLVFLFVLPAFIIFDFIPKLFGYRGVTSWYIDTHKKPADEVVIWYALFELLIGILVYVSYIFIQTLKLIY